MKDDIKKFFNSKRNNQLALEGDETLYILLSQEEVNKLLKKEYNKSLENRVFSQNDIENCLSELQEINTPYVLLTENTGMEDIEPNLWPINLNSLMQLASYEEDEIVKAKLESFAKHYNEYLQFSEIDVEAESLEKMILVNEFHTVLKKVKNNLKMENNVPESDLLQIEQKTDDIINETTEILKINRIKYLSYFIKKGLVTTDMLADMIDDFDLNKKKKILFDLNHSENYTWHFLNRNTFRICDFGRTFENKLISTRLYSLKEILEEIISTIQ